MKALVRIDQVAAEPAVEHVTPNRFGTRATLLGDRLFCAQPRTDCTSCAVIHRAVPKEVADSAVFLRFRGESTSEQILPAPPLNLTPFSSSIRTTSYR